MINKTFVEMLDALGYDIELTYVTGGKKPIDVRKLMHILAEYQNKKP